jgi:hypothetical protein
MRRILFALPLLATTMAFAQAPVQAPVQPRPFTLNHAYPLDQPQIHYPFTGWSCPVGMTAEQQAFGATQWVISLEDSRIPDMEARARSSRSGVRVDLKAPRNWAFKSARVAVSYMVPQTGTMLVGAGFSINGGRPATKTFDLSAGEDPAQELERTLLLGSAVNVTQVRLISLTYPDGSVWQPGRNYSCSVGISHLLPVAAAR